MLPYNHSEKSKKKDIDNQQSSTSNTVVVEDWTNEVNSHVVGKIKLSCANDTPILLIEFIEKKDMAGSLLTKEEKNSHGLIIDDNDLAYKTTIYHSLYEWEAYFKVTD